MSKSIVRLALDGSVAWTVAAGEVPQQPGVDGAERTGRSSAATPPSVSSHSTFDAEKYGSSTRPVVGADAAARCPAAASSSQRAAVRRSCQTMARWRGRPVRRSHATTVSRWSVMPMAATGWPSAAISSAW